MPEFVAFGGISIGYSYWTGNGIANRQLGLMALISRSTDPDRAPSGRGQRVPIRACSLIIAGLTLTVAAGGPPPSGGEFTLRRATIDAGGGEGSGADFSLKGTIGQHDTEVMTGSDFTLRGGFWTPSGPSDFLFRDGFES